MKKNNEINYLKRLAMRSWVTIDIVTKNRLKLTLTMRVNQIKPQHQLCNRKKRLILL